MKRLFAIGVLTNDEARNILWLCEKLSEKAALDKATNDMQHLHGVLAGILADGIVTEDELRGLSDWLDEHDHLKTMWPYDEISAIAISAMTDRKISDEEQKLLQAHFSELVRDKKDDVTITNPSLLENESLPGICAVCPEISFANACFCFTGASARFKRNELRAVVERLGGRFTNTISKSVDYLIIGADGNPCWAYACYGRKVEEAVKLRKQMCKILLVHENDFHDAIADLG